MKITLSLLALCFLGTTAALGQSAGGPPLASTYQSPDHPLHAFVQPMAHEQSLLVTSSVYVAQGEMPLWEVPLPKKTIVPLGDVARLQRKEHASVKKATKVWTN